MNIMDESSGNASPITVRPQAVIVAEIKGVLGRGYRRFMITGPSGSRRLACAKRALLESGYQVVIVDLAGVRSRSDLDRAVQRTTGGKDFFDGMWRIEKKAMKRPSAIVFHNFDDCLGSSGMDHIVYRVWIEARNHCLSSLVFFTVRRPEFCAHCFKLFEPCRTFLYPIKLEAAN